jgi:hypothetical protein
LLNGVPLSIWYDWKNDGHDPADNEQNFGTVTYELQPKPAYDALRQMTRELDGFALRQRVETGDEKDFVLLFARKGGRKIAAWTLAPPHTVRLAPKWPEISLELGPMPQYVAVK